MTVAAIGLGGADHGPASWSRPGPSRAGPSGWSQLIAEALPRLRAAAGPGRVCGVGVSVPGTVDLATGRIGVAPNLGWEDVALRAMLEEALPGGVPVVVATTPTSRSSPSTSVATPATATTSSS